MEFGLSDHEALVQQTAREVAADLFRHQAARRAIGDRQARLDGWRRVHELGWTGILLPAELGGAGATLVEACLVAEALHQAFPFVPFAGSAIAAAAHLRFAAADPELLRRLAAGEPFSVLLGADLACAPAVAEAAFDWIPGATGLLVTGAAVTAVPIEPTLVDTIDLLHLVARVPAMDGGGELGPGLHRAVAYSRVGMAAALTGVAQACLDDAVAYARDRHQFDRPIGDFQAVQHLCAEMLVDVEACRSVAYGAAWTVEHGSDEEASVLAASAKAWCAEAAIRVAQNSIQVLGGIGMTWEHPAHLRLRSAHVLGRAFGTPARLATELGRGAVGRARAQG